MWITWLLLAGAGLVAGVSGTVTGVGSIVTYPALLASGLPATGATVTNTVALALGGAGGVVGSRPDLVGQAPVLRRLCGACVLGSVVGSALLLVSPPGVVERVVPFLVAVASVSILLPRRRREEVAGGRSGRATVLGMLAVSVYNGYFAAAGGVLIAAVLLVTTASPLVVVGALRNVLVLVGDVVAAAAFAAFGPVHWPDVPPLAVGLFAGSLVGPAVARRMPVLALRVLVAAAGLALAVLLGLGALG